MIADCQSLDTSGGGGGFRQLAFVSISSATIQSVRGSTAGNEANEVASDGEASRSVNLH